MNSIKSLALSITLTGIVFPAFLLNASLVQAQNPDLNVTRNIIVINSWHKDLPWQKSVEQGLKQSLRASNTRTQIFVENLDFGRFSADTQSVVVEKYLLGKYANKRIDLIVTEGIPAATFIGSRPHMFPQVQRIYVQPGAEAVKQEGGQTVQVLQDYETALREMHRLVSPETVYVIADVTSPSARRRLEDYQNAVKSLDGSFKSVVLSNLSMKDLLAKVSQLGDNDVIFYLPLFKDGDGKKFVPLVAVKQIAAKANRPVFSKWESLLGSGIVGGYLLSGERVGQITASIITGTNKTQSLSPYVSMYDWRQLKRWGINEAKLPPGAFIRYRESNLLDQYFWELVSALSTIVLLTVMSVTLFIVNRKRKLAVAALKGEHQQLEGLVSERTKELQLSEARYLSIVDMQTELVSRFTYDGTLTYVNRAYCEFIGEEEENLVGHSLYDNIPEEEVAAVRSYFASFTQENPVRKNENRLKRKDGKLRDIEWSNYAQFDEDGNIDRFQSVGRDVTERKQTEAALKASEARYYSVVDGQSELITRFTPDGRFTFVNGAYCRFCGRTEDEVLGGTIFDDVPENEVDVLKSYLASFSKNNPIQEIENKLRRHDGEYRDIQWHDTAYFDNQGNVTEFQSVARDVSSQKKAKLELELATEKAQEANIAKSNFLATMSHEIRTPLNGVLGLAQLLTDSNLDKDQRKKVDTILSSGQTLLAIINDVLDMSKIEAGGLELEETVFSLRDLVATIATPFQSLADDKGLKLRVTNTLKSNVLLKGDPVRLRQILWNLLSNAIKFTSQGSVTLTIDSVKETDVDSHTRTLQFLVTDTGTGIAADRVSSVFEAFTQEDSTITRKFGGTGLGLSIVKQLTEMMGGNISVESELGTGTTFSAVIPFIKATSTEKQDFSLGDTQNSEHSAVSLKILVAEDNAVNSMIAMAFLEKFGHKARLAENGREAVAIASENWADIILMDIHMPEMDGIEATKLIRALNDNVNTPIIGLTAEAFSERHQHFIEIGMNAVLTKPFTEAQLAKTLNHFSPHDVSVNVGADDSSLTPDDDCGASPTPFDAYPVGDDLSLNELKGQMPAELMSSLIEEAIKSLQTRVVQIHEGLETSDTTLIREAAHSIKGASGTMFATRISEIAKFCEENSDNFDALKGVLPIVDQTVKDTITWWNQKQD